MFVDAVFRRLREYFAADAGLDLSDFIARIESHFSVAISPADAAQFITLGDLTDWIALRQGESVRALSRSDIWAAVRRITSDEMGLAESELHEGIRFVEDLCC